MERYRIIYTLKILEGIAPNVGIQSYTSTSKIRAIREGSFQIRGSTAIQQPRSKTFVVRQDSP